MEYFIKEGIAGNKKRLKEEKEAGYVKWLFELSDKDVLTAGQKGASLADMYSNKFSVPPAFIISAQTFEKFTAGIAEEIKKIIEDTDVDDTFSLNESSR